MPFISKALRYGPCITRDHTVSPATHTRSSVEAFGTDFCHCDGYDINYSVTATDRLEIWDSICRPSRLLQRHYDQLSSTDVGIDV